jgi:hypothetical protein
MRPVRLRTFRRRPLAQRRPAAARPFPGTLFQSSVSQKLVARCRYELGQMRLARLPFLPPLDSLVCSLVRHGLTLILYGMWNNLSPGPALSWLLAFWTTSRAKYHADFNLPAGERFRKIVSAPIIIMLCNALQAYLSSDCCSPVGQVFISPIRMSTPILTLCAEAQRTSVAIQAIVRNRRSACACDPQERKDEIIPVP